MRPVEYNTELKRHHLNQAHHSFGEELRSTDIENKLMVTKGERGVGRDKLGVWD